MLLLAAAIVIDGFLGPENSPMNLAGVLPWTHWRAFTVVALLVAGNFFCMVCPFTWVRDLGRRLLPANRNWPRMLRSKWTAIVLLGVYLWAYEVFSLWDRPAWTAGILLGYFAAAFVIDGVYRGASFCKYVCPIGQFHFVQSLCSPLEVRIRKPDACASCRTYDCIRGNETRRGCELQLFLPRKSGNMDCTFCLDCVRACPSDNVGMLATTPGADLWKNVRRSSVGSYGERPDIAALALLLTFGAFANAAGMVAPVVQWAESMQARYAAMNSAVFFSIFIFATAVFLPTALTGLASWVTRLASGTDVRMREIFGCFSMTLVPLGAAMWLAHFLFHFFTGSHTPIPVFQRIWADLGFSGGGEPSWNIGSLAFEHLPGMELLILDCGLLLALYAAWRVAGRIAPARPFRAFLPWGLAALALFAAGVWILFQPMEMRGTLGVLWEAAFFAV